MKSQYLRIILALSVIALIFIARLSYLQLFTDRYALNAANTSIKIEYVIPPRGVIFDRNGKILVGNQPAFEISYTAALLKPDFDTLGFCKLVNISKPEFIKTMKNIEKEKYYSRLTP
ncbi:MAG: peptidoglycan glycosyltransferase, partial [Chryseobacterium sp.]|nr:peptidoglycan glycosyltransferase [Chryseobacterium sp.]